MSNLHEDTIHPPKPQYLNINDPPDHHDVEKIPLKSTNTGYISWLLCIPHAPPPLHGFLGF